MLTKPVVNLNNYSLVVLRGSTTSISEVSGKQSSPAAGTTVVEVVLREAINQNWLEFWYFNCFEAPFIATSFSGVLLARGWNYQPDWPANPSLRPTGTGVSRGENRTFQNTAACFSPAFAAFPNAEIKQASAFRRVLRSHVMRSSQSDSRLGFQARRTS